MTAEIIVQSDHGKRVKIQALLDTGSSAFLVTHHAANQLALCKLRQTTKITGIHDIYVKPSNYLAVFSAEKTCPEMVYKDHSCTSG